MYVQADRIREGFILLSVKMPV